MADEAQLLEPPSYSELTSSDGWKNADANGRIAGLQKWGAHVADYGAQQHGWKDDQIAQFNGKLQTQIAPYQAVNAALETPRLIATTPGGIIGQAEAGKAIDEAQFFAGQNASPSHEDLHQFIKDAYGNSGFEKANSEPIDMRLPHAIHEAGQFLDSLNSKTAQMSPEDWQSMRNKLKSFDWWMGRSDEVSKSHDAELTAPEIEWQSKIGSGLERVAAKNLDFITSPEGVALLGIGGLPEAARENIAGAFALQMASQLPEQSIKLAKSKDLSEATENLGDILSTAAFAGLGGLGYLGKFKKAPPIIAAEKSTSLPSAAASADLKTSVDAALHELAPNLVEPKPPSPAAAQPSETTIPVTGTASTGEPLAPHDLSSVSALNGRTVPEAMSALGKADPNATGLPVASMVTTKDGRAFFGANHSLAMAAGEAIDPSLRADNSFDRLDLFVKPNGEIIDRAGAKTQFGEDTAQNLITQPKPSDVHAEVQGGIPHGKVLVSEIATRPELMQFKASDDLSSGTNAAERIAAKTWDVTKEGRPLLWEPKDPSKYGLAPGEKYIVADAHHRLEFAKRVNQLHFEDAQILREADGYSASDAMVKAAENNIVAGKGTIYDRTKFLRNVAATHGADEAIVRAKEQGFGGRNESAIAFSASEPTYTAFINERIGEKEAVAIAKAAPRDEAAQQVGLRAALEKGVSQSEITARMEAARNAAQRAPAARQGDFFADTSLDDQWKAQGKYVAQKRAALQDEIRAKEPTLKRYETATKTGSISADQGKVRKEVDAAKAELARWEKWADDPQLRGEVERLGKPVVAGIWNGENLGELPVTALKMLNGEVYIDPEAAVHATAINNLGLDPSKVESGGFVVGSEYKEGSADADSIARMSQARDRLKAKRASKTIAEDVAPLISGEPTKTHEQLAAEAAASEAEKVRLQKKQDIRTGATKPLQAPQVSRPEADMFAPPEKQGDIFDKKKALASDWVSATDDAPQTTEAKNRAIKMKLKGQGEKGFVDTSILSDLVDYAHDKFKEGMTRVKWIAHAVAEFGKDVRDMAGRAWDKVSAAYRGSRFASESGSIFGVKGDLLKRKMSELDEATAERSLRLQKSFEEATAAQKEINKEVPDEKRQNAISVWREAGGDTAMLQGWEAAAKGKMFKQAAKDAQALSPEEQAIAQKAIAAFDVLESRGNKYDVLGSHRENYIPHVWEVEKKGTGFGGARLQDKFKFSKARTFDTFFDGDQAGFTPKTLAIGNLLPAYLHEMNRVIADRQFVADVHTKSAKTGEPLVIPRGRVSSVENDSGGKATLVNPDAWKTKKDAAGNPIDQRKYQVLENQPALHDWLWEGKDESGNPIYMKDDLSVHPELAKRLNAMMGQSAIRKWYNEPSEGLSVIPRVIAKNLDVAQSVMKREMFGFLAPFHQVQEGTHGVGHMVNPTYNIPEINLRKDAGQQDAVRHGLMLLPEKGSSQSYLEGVGGKGAFPSQLARKFGGKAGKVAADVVDGYQDYLFHSYIPGLKFKTYEHILSRNMDRFSNDVSSGKMSEADVKLMSAEQTNAAYGHLNYALLNRNPTNQHILQLLLLAPDFLEARSRFVGQALKSVVGEKSGHEQLRAIATLAAIQAGIAYTVTTLAGDQYDPHHPFEIKHGDRTYYLRSVPEDLFRLIASGAQTRREFLSARVNPMAQKLDQLRTGLNYRGEKIGAMETMGEMLTNYIPITARWLPGVRQLTETSRNSPVSPLEQLAGSFGVKVSRFSPILKTHELANKWMDAQKIPKQEGIYPTSKFQQLRYSLEDADMDRAKTEYEKLTKTQPALKVSSGFRESLHHPFTGSEKTDAEFASSLKGYDKMMYEHALETKRKIETRFNLLGAPNRRSTGRMNLRP